MRNFILLLLATAFLTSCSTLNKSRMLKTPRNYKFEEFVDSVSYKEEYKIAIDDEIRIRMYSNDGYNYISLTGGNNNVNQAGSGGGSGFGNDIRNDLLYKVRLDSTIKVPLIGKIKVEGLNIEELESKIESLLKTQFNSPFVISEIFNRRVYLFKGGSTASIIELENQNSTLFEILARSGGLGDGENASRIKLIRGDLENPQIYLIDLSTIEGMKKANMNLKAGDIVYIDPFINYATRITSDISSILALLSSVLLAYTVTQ